MKKSLVIYITLLLGGVPFSFCQVQPVISLEDPLLNDYFQDSAHIPKLTGTLMAIPLKKIGLEE